MAKKCGKFLPFVSLRRNSSRKNSHAISKHCWRWSNDEVTAAAAAFCEEWECFRVHRQFFMSRSLCYFPIMKSWAENSSTASRTSSSTAFQVKVSKTFQVVSIPSINSKWIMRMLPHLLAQLHRRISHRQKNFVILCVPSSIRRAFTTLRAPKKGCCVLFGTLMAKQQQHQPEWVTLIQTSGEVGWVAKRRERDDK